MANLALNCSISKQDCPQYNSNSRTVNFTSSSCVPYHYYQPWYTNDTGACGWVGAPCITLAIPGSNTNNSNCNVDSGFLCVDGRCGFGLGDRCPVSSNCNGDIRCGSHDKCGGNGAFVSYTSIDGCNECTPVRELCISGIASNTTSPDHYFLCESDEVSTRAVAGGTAGGLAVLLALIIWYLCRNHARKTRPSSLYQSVAITRSLDLQAETAPAAQEMPRPITLTMTPQREAVRSHVAPKGQVAAASPPASQPSTSSAPQPSTSSTYADDIPPDDPPPYM